MTYYILQVIHYHINNENTSLTTIAIYVFAIVFGYTINIISSLTYFLSTNKNIFKKLGISANLDDEKQVNSLFTKQENIYETLKNNRKWHVEMYLHTPFIVKPARDISHYDKKMLKSVISQNHLNASFFEIVIFISLIGLGLFSENVYCVIPAGASIILFFTILFILMSAFYAWFKGWTTIIFVSLFFLINHLSKNDQFNYDNMAYGLNYTSEKADYSNQNLYNIGNNLDTINSDKKNAIAILNNWKNKNNSTTKPKIVFINTSGGGSRSMLWTFYMLQTSDSLTNGKLFNQTHLITGSSGGMIGASYFREFTLSFFVKLANY